MKTKIKRNFFREISKREAEPQTDEALPATREDDVHKRLYLTGTSDPIQTRLQAETPTDALPAEQRGSIIIPPGFYDVDWFEFLLNAIPGVSFRVHRDSKRVTLTVVDASLKVRLNKEVAKLFNLPKVKLAPNVIYEGKYDMNPFKLLFIHCPQLNGSYNYHNGQPQTC